MSAVSAANSVAMLQRVIRASMSSARTAPPAYSTAHPRPPAAPCRAKIWSARSLAVTPGASRPSTEMRIVRGRLMRSVPVASACSASVEPIPHAKAPIAPWVQVWLSGQTTVAPGRTRPSSGEITWTIPCNGSRTSKTRMPAASAAERVSRMKAEPPGIRVASPRPGVVSTMWSMVQKTRDGSRTGRPDSARLLRATEPVRSCRNMRSIAISDDPSPSSRTTCGSQIFSNRLRGPMVAILRPPAGRCPDGSQPQRSSLSGAD